MRITFGNYEICAAGETPAGFSASLKRLLQSDSAIGFENAVVSDRGNSKSELSFAVERPHKTPEAAEEALFETMYEAAGRSPADLKIEFAGGRKQKVFRCAALSKCRGAIDGRITRHTFEFSSGKDADNGL